jgi:tRNA nucleotidyltransferase/poly(A) polymerase
MSSTEAIELLHKVSRERVFTELEKILTGPRPVDGLSLIAKPKLHNFILNPINGKKKGMADMLSAYQQMI